MDSEPFVGDFGLGMPLDNRYMNLGGMGAMAGSGGANDLMNPAGLDFSNSMMMMDSNASMVGPPGSSTGMIDFPDELNSPKNASSTANLSGVTTNASMSVSSDAGALGGDGAIPFPAALANDTPLTMNPTAANPAAAQVQAVQNQNRTAAMNGGSAAMNFSGMDMNASAMNVNMNPAMNGGAVNMTMPMNMGMTPGYMPDMNMGFAMNPMFMNGGGAYNPMAGVQPQQMNGMMVNMGNGQMYFQPQQQQQEYLRMLQQQRQSQLQFATMQQQQQLAKAQQAQQAQVQQQQVAGQQNNAAAVAQQLQRQQQMQALQQQMAMQQQQQQAQANGVQATGPVATAQQLQQQRAAAQQQGQATAVAAGTQRQFQATPGQPQQQQQQQPTMPAALAPNTSSTGVRQPWHSPADHALRREMSNHIMRVLQSQKSNAPANWLQRLPEMARRLEDECYRISTSREEYANTSTLQSRLKNIVRAAQSQQRGRVSTPSGPMSQAPSMTSTATSVATTAARPASGSSPALKPMPIPFPGAEAVKSATATPIKQQPNMAAAQPLQMPAELQGPGPSTAIKMETAQAIPMPLELQNPATTPATASASTAQATAQANAKQAMFDAAAASNAAAVAAASQSRSAQFLRQFKARAQHVTSSLEEEQKREYHNKLQSMTTSDVMNANSKGVLQRQQQRLLLLRHAMSCKAPEGTCLATPSCGEMKRLWQHMGNCKETTPCAYSHCISSKYVLSHFQQCENMRCLVCQLLRYPVEVKEKNGALIMDTDRALQQIQAATERRLAHQGHSLDPTTNSTAPTAPTASTAVDPARQQQQQLGSANPFQQAPSATSGQPQMQQQQPVAPPPVTSQPIQTAVQQTAMNGRPTMSMPQSTSQPVATATVVPTSQTKAAETNVPGLTEEENRQLALIQQRLGGVSLEQLTLNSKKLENYAEQVRTQVNAIMNECRQLMQMRNSTQDPAMQTQFDAQVQAKKVTLQDLHQKYKKCTSQHRIVKHVISARMSGAPIGGVASAATVPPASQPSQPASTVPASTTMTNGHSQFPVNMQPLSMPPGLETPQAPMSQPAPQTRPQVPAQTSMQGAVQQSFSAQLQQAQGSLVQSHAPVTSQGPAQSQQQRGGGGVTSQAANDILGQSLGMPLGSNDVPMPMPMGLAAAGKPLDMPSELSMTSKPLAMPENLQSGPMRAAQSAPTPVPAAVANPKKAEPTVNPLTMNNSKLNAMMVEHQRMDAAKVKLEPAAVTVTPSATTAIVPATSTAAASSSGAPAASGDVPTSMLNELTNEELKAHIDSLIIGYNATMQPLTLKKRLEGLLKGMMDHKFGWVFSSPVDPVALGIPDYFKIIRRPMDLGTVKKKLDAGVYKHTDQFAHDVRTTFENAKTFNREDQDVYNLAKDMLNDFNAEMRKLEAEIHADECKAREGDSACRLCGVERMVFEPAVLYCNGECNSRIRRNCYYFCAPDNKYHCCQPCMANLPDTVTTSEGKPYKKTELTKKKNDEVHEEPWVQCDSCNRWVHQICALFNGKIEAEKKPHMIKSDPSTGKAAQPGPTTTHLNGHAISSTPGSEFLCPECLLDHRLKEPQKYTVGKHAFSAKDLMRTKLSDFLERRIYKALQDEREDEARWTNKDIKEIATAEHLTVRLVSNIEKQLMVRDKMFQRYKDSHKYTSEHRFKSKCICMFQEIHGVSVLLFGMYVHEFDEQEADCNSRRVYISYLDSVNYFEPPHLRTKVYHEVLVAYLEFVRQRGFHTAHLWACPPLKGDDYILYCHPESQKTPKSDRLRQWYVDMLIKAQGEGIALHISNLYDEYWRNNNTACALPYFEGDYWVGLAEEAIEKIDAEKPKKKKATNKRKASETKKPSKKSKSKKTKRRKTSTAGSVENGDDNGTGSDGDGDGEDAEEEVTETSAYEPVVVKEKALTSLDDVDRTITDPLMKKMGEIIEPMKDDFLVVKLQPYCRLCNTPVLKGTLWRDPTTSTELGLNPKTVHVTLCGSCYDKAKASPSAKLQDQLKRLVAETVTWPEKCTDPDEINDSEYFDTRQAFLSLCQGNHYQFDELRRAKHSSMMALYHLGNPNPNAYVYECNACTRDIVSGNRWHCHTCPDFDVCDACYAKEKHEHALEKIPTSGVAGAKGQSSGGKAHGALTDEQRRLREQRAKNVRLHMQLLVHASGCDGSCGSANCEKMKELMRHGAQCKLRALGGCTVCRRVWALLQLHARQCRQYECKVPRCHDLREHVRKLQLQQQLMDDRRRAAVTQQYRQMQNGGPSDGTGDDGEHAGGGGAGGGP